MKDSVHKKHAKEPQSETPNESTFPPKKCHVNLNEYLDITEYRAGVEYPPNCFEDANHLYLLEYGEREAHLTFAMSKELYCIRDSAGILCLYDFYQHKYDARFVIGPDTVGRVQFGIFKDGNLGRLFYFTEPKDATHMFLALPDHEGARFKWLQAECEAKCHHYHRSDNAVYAVLPIGTRFDEESMHIICSSIRADEDRELFQKLFLESLHRFAGDKHFPRTTFQSVAPPPTHEELVAKAEVRRKNEELRTELAGKTIKVCTALNKKGVDGLVEKYGLAYLLFTETFYRENSHLEIVQYRLQSRANWDENALIISIAGETFMASPVETIAEYLMEKTTKLLNSHKDTYRAYKGIYDANKAYHDYVNYHSIKPELNYKHIFGTTDIFIESPEELELNK